MSYGDAQLEAISHSRERSLARGSAAVHALKGAAIRAVQRNPVASIATVVVGGLATLSVAKLSRRAPRTIKKLGRTAISLLRLEGALAVVRSLGNSSLSDKTPPMPGAAAPLPPAKAQ